MSLDEIAAGLEVTTAQRDRGVAVADDTDVPLAERLRDFAGDLPCTPEAAATLVGSYAGGASVGDAARDASVASVTAAKALHRLGEDVSPLAPRGREVVRDWLDARLSRADAKELTRLDDDAFALAVYVETHGTIPGAEEALAGALAVEPSDPLADARSGLGDLL
ncbi:hypothetical protein [Halosegnis marinus]|uniref:Uncharacterized protein n=1 Tax=Halosegnis marinus TaxID=3034023 RepID=A0ABD5ZPK9_9EURY|nr:hypothetical protein [Halosegnis sp. DT85]